MVTKSTDPGLCYNLASCCAVFLIFFLVFFLFVFSFLLFGSLNRPVTVFPSLTILIIQCNAITIWYPSLKQILLRDLVKGPLFWRKEKWKRCSSWPSWWKNSGTYLWYVKRHDLPHSTITAEKRSSGKVSINLLVTSHPWFHPIIGNYLLLFLRKYNIYINDPFTIQNLPNLVPIFVNISNLYITIWRVCVPVFECVCVYAVVSVCVRVCMCVCLSVLICRLQQRAESQPPIPLPFSKRLQLPIFFIIRVHPPASSSCNWF